MCVSVLGTPWMLTARKLISFTSKKTDFLKISPLSYIFSVPYFWKPINKMLDILIYPLIVLLVVFLISISLCFSSPLIAISSMYV